MAVDVVSSARQRSVPGQTRYLVAESSDHAASLALKLAAAASPRVILVIPDDNAYLDSPVALRILARAANRESISLALVTRRRRLQRAATIEGIAVFPTLSSVPRDQDPDALPSPVQESIARLTSAARQSVSWLVAVSLAIVIVAVIALGVPRAVVYVRPVTDRLSGTVRVQVSPDISEPDVTRVLLPGRTVYLLVQSSGTIPVSSKDHPMDGRAVGYITFENRVNDRVTVPKGTDLSTFSGVHFETTRTVVLDDHPGATAVVPIVASAPGAFGNVSRGQIVVIGGRLRWVMVAVNEDPTAGGGPPGQPIVTPWETHKLLDQVMADTKTKAQQRLAESLSSDEFVIPESVEITPIEESFDHAIGDSASSLGVHVQSRVKALIINRRSLDNLVMQAWHPVLRSGFVPVPNSIQIGTPAVTRVDSTGATLDVPLTATAYAEVNTDRIASYARLRSPAAAEHDLARLYGFVAPPKVTIVPGWLPFAYRVQVVVDMSVMPTTSAASKS